MSVNPVISKQGSRLSKTADSKNRQITDSAADTSTIRLYRSRLLGHHRYGVSSLGDVVVAALMAQPALKRTIPQSKKKLGTCFSPSSPFRLRRGNLRSLRCERLPGLAQP